MSEGIINNGDVHSMTLPTRCDAPAPLALNAIGYAGCQLKKDHDDKHMFTVTWPR